MAKKYFSSCGRSKKGDFSGCYVWHGGGNTYIVVNDTLDTADGRHMPNMNAVSYGSLFANFFTYKEVLDALEQNKKYEITSSIIEKMVDVGSYQSGPNANAFVKGSLTAGTGFGTALAMASMSSGQTIAVYMNDGKKMLIEFNSIEAATTFKSRLYEFEF